MSSILLLAAVREELVVDLARADDHARHLLRRRACPISPITVWNSPLASSSSGDTASLCRSRLFGRHHDQRLAVPAQHLPAQHVEDLRRRRRHAHLHVVLRAELQEALGTRRRVLGALPFVAVRQQHHEAADAAPLHFAGADELVDHDLRAVGEIAELRFPDDELRSGPTSSSRTRSPAPLARSAPSR